MIGISIQPDKFLVWFWINTEHGDNLEFVLDAAKNRNRTDYLDALWNCMRDALRKAGIKGAAIKEQNVYGGVSYQLQTDALAQVPPALTVCEAAVRDWARRYRVNSMKKDASA